MDQVYMAFVQGTTGHGGWPLSVFLTPDLKPFYGGTYFPPESRRGMPGFKQVLLRIAEEWESKPEAILSSAGRVTDQMKQLAQVAGDGKLQLAEALLDKTYHWYEEHYDAGEGGFGSAPKFPRPVNFNFLFRYQARKGEGKALQMAVETLRKMAEGGMHDHIGGGFHRYSTDERWFLPHFEKMLYDQAQLAVSYLDAYRITGEKYFEEVASGIFGYILRDLRNEEGGFYSAEDADSAVSHGHAEEKAEGAFYLWTHQEISELLGKDAPVFNSFYAVKEEGNVERDPFGEFRNKNVLHVSAKLEETARHFDTSIEQVENILQRGRRTLFETRSKRPKPALDDKILTCWNGLTISALARGYQVLGEEKYLEAACRAAAFIADKLYDGRSQRLMRRYREGEAGIEGMLDDYAFYIQGLLDLYESSLEGRWVLLALELAEIQHRLFWDAQNGGYFNTAGQDPSILIRMKEDYDGAEPAPNSVAVLNLLRLAEMSGEKKWREMAEASLEAYEARLQEAPYAMPQMMAAVNFYLDKPRQILIAGEPNSSDTRALLRQVHGRFIPNKVVVLADGGRAHQRLARNLEILDRLERIEGKATAYVCQNYVCKLPTNDPTVVARLLEGENSSRRSR